MKNTRFMPLMGRHKALCKTYAKQVRGYTALQHIYLNRLRVHSCETTVHWNWTVPIQVTITAAFLSLLILAHSYTGYVAKMQYGSQAKSMYLLGHKHSSLVMNMQVEANKNTHLPIFPTNSSVTLSGSIPCFMWEVYVGNSVFNSFSSIKLG